MTRTLFMRDPTALEHPSYEGPPLTEEMVAHAEAALGVTLPVAYVELMRECNGGYTSEEFAHPTARPTSWAPDHVPVGSLHGIPAIGQRDRFGTRCGILATEYMTEEWDLPPDLVLLTGSGHWWIALDYRESGPSGPATVAWIDVDSGEDIQLADTFESFIEQLVPAHTFESDD